MTRNLRLGLVGGILVLALLSCNMPEQFPPPNEMQTAAALTLQAILTPSRTSQASTATAATSSPRVTQTISPTGSPDTTTITPTYSVPMLTVRRPVTSSGSTSATK